MPKISAKEPKGCVPPMDSLGMSPIDNPGAVPPPGVINPGAGKVEFNPGAGHQVTEINPGASHQKR